MQVPTRAVSHATCPVPGSCQTPKQKLSLQIQNFEVGSRELTPLFLTKERMWERRALRLSAGGTVLKVEALSLNDKPGKETHTWERTCDCHHGTQIHRFLLSDPTFAWMHPGNRSPGFRNSWSAQGAATRVGAGRDGPVYWRTQCLPHVTPLVRVYAHQTPHWFTWRLQGLVCLGSFIVKNLFCVYISLRGTPSYTTIITCWACQHQPPGVLSKASASPDAWTRFPDPTNVPGQSKPICPSPRGPGSTDTCTPPPSGPQPCGGLH